MVLRGSAVSYERGTHAKQCLHHTADYKGMLYVPSVGKDQRAFRVQGFSTFRSKASGLRFRVSGSGSRVSGFGSRGYRFRVSDFGFRVSGVGLQISRVGRGFLVSSFEMSVEGDLVRDGKDGEDHQADHGHLRGADSYPVFNATKGSHEHPEMSSGRAGCRMSIFDWN